MLPPKWVPKGQTPETHPQQAYSTAEDHSSCVLIRMLLALFPDMLLAMTLVQSSGKLNVRWLLWHLLACSSCSMSALSAVLAHISARKPSGRSDEKCAGSKAE